MSDLNKYIRVLKNFATWQSNSTYRFTTQCMLFATVWLCFPYKSQCFWLVRVAAWLVLGPWMKLLDVWWIRRYYRTRDELLRDGVPETTDAMKEDIASRPNILEPLLQAKWLETMANRGRVVIEDNVKLRDFRKEVFGKYSENIPLFDFSRYPSIPLPTSYARPSVIASKDQGTAVSEEATCWTSVCGQRLYGTMIPQTELLGKDGNKDT
jgi:hypothetical protein